MDPGKHRYALPCEGRKAARREIFEFSEVVAICDHLLSRENFQNAARCVVA